MSDTLGPNSSDALLLAYRVRQDAARLKLEEVRADLLDAENRFRADLGVVHSDHIDSATNLLHYVAFRQRDLRETQLTLSEMGLSSLGRAEGHVLAAVEVVLRNLRVHAGVDVQGSSVPALAFQSSRTVLQRNADRLLGVCRPGHANRIMVTMPSEAATDPALVHNLVAAGMDCMRINCAHDGPAVWDRMIANLRAAEAALGRSCRIMFDVAGPKLRTGPIAPGPRIVKYRPRVDTFGRVSAPARVFLAPIDGGEPAPPLADAVLPVPADWLAGLMPGDRVLFTDVRGKTRWMDATRSECGGWWTEAMEGAFVAPGTTLRRARVDPSDSTGATAEARVGPLAPLTQDIHLKSGETLTLTAAPDPGRPAVYDRHGRMISPACISCTLPEVLADLKEGERVWIDDGKIGGVIKAVRQGEVDIELTFARPRGERIREDKGLNFPDSALSVTSLTPRDIQDIEFIAKHGDLIGFSFVRSASDVLDLQHRLAELGRPDLGIVLKIETRTAFENLPELLLTAMRASTVGVMIARGDLAVEMGFERMAEVQEEILWMCQAARVPVIWATQVLEMMAKKGRPSRAEITDAAMGERAECVMLNKGPYIVATVRALDDILLRMEKHQMKKVSLLRRLNVAGRFLARKA